TPWPARLINKCSTPVGIEEVVAQHCRAPRAGGGRAQRLSASKKSSLPEGYANPLRVVRAQRLSASKKSSRACENVVSQRLGVLNACRHRRSRRTPREKEETEFSECSTPVGIEEVVAGTRRECRSPA